MEWTVVGVIIALAGLIGGITAPVVKFNTAVTRLSVVVDSLDKAIAQFATDNKEEHCEIWEAVERCECKQGDHETRITVLEHKG